MKILAFNSSPRPKGNSSILLREMLKGAGDNKHQVETIASAPFLTEALECVNEVVVIINAERQIVFANRRFPGRSDDEIHQQYHGMRPGEALRCVHAVAGYAPDGCGTTDFCSTCGAVRAVLESQKRGSGLQECNILLGDGSDPPLPRSDRPAVPGV